MTAVPYVVNIIDKCSGHIIHHTCTVSKLKNIACELYMFAYDRIDELDISYENGYVKVGGEDGVTPGKIKELFARLQLSWTACALMEKKWKPVKVTYDEIYAYFVKDRKLADEEGDDEEEDEEEDYGSGEEY